MDRDGDTTRVAERGGLNKIVDGEKVDEGSQELAPACTLKVEANKTNEYFTCKKPVSRGRKLDFCSITSIHWISQI